MPAPSAKPVATSGSTAASIDPNTTNSTISAAKRAETGARDVGLDACSATWPPTATCMPRRRSRLGGIDELLAWLTVNFEACLDIVTIANAT